MVRVGMGPVVPSWYFNLGTVARWQRFLPAAAGYAARSAGSDD